MKPPPGLLIFLEKSPLIEHPLCKSCGVAMWLIDMRESTKEYIYECKACNGRMEVDGNRSVNDPKLLPGIPTDGLI
jgi:hypothetical protein